MYTLIASRDRLFCTESGNLIEEEEWCCPAETDSWVRDVNLVFDVLLVIYGLHSTQMHDTPKKTIRRAVWYVLLQYNRITIC